MSTAPSQRRILVIDDNEAVHEDYRKVLGNDYLVETSALDALMSEVFGEAQQVARSSFEIDSAHQGAEGLVRVRQALAEGRPYAMAFVDVRMPPGWDGIETVSRIWKDDPELQVVICSAYADYSWDQIVAALGETDRFVILRKPFDNIEVRQLACAMTAKWALGRQARARLEDLEAAVLVRTRELELANGRLREEIAGRERVEAALQQAQRLEAMGRLAAGIAHEINSPMQYVASSLEFIDRSVPALLALARARIDGHSLENEMLDAMASELPAALADAQTGVQRVSEIVRSMKSLAHHGQTALTPVDLNRTLQSALTVCHSECRYVADVVQELGEVPLVLGIAADLGRTFINLIVNAIDAIRDTTKGTERRGRLTVSTTAEGGWVVAAIKDDGAGIPETIRDRIFEPFFTTKDVGRGTGQGLAIAWSTVVERLGGVLDFETHAGEGTTFYVRLPIAGARKLAA